MAQTTNLPVFQTELVDGGLVVNTSNIVGDLIVVIGFAAVGVSSADIYINQPIRLNKGDEADFVYGFTASGSSISRAVYEVLDGGATTVFAMNLGQWGTAIYTNDQTGISQDIFVNNGDGTYTIKREVYYLALNKAYSLLKNFNADILYPADAFAADIVTVASGLIDVVYPGTISISGRPTRFDYQLASNLFDMSSQNNEAIGVINVSGCVSGTLSAVATYIGTSPTFDPLGNLTTNGTGLLGDAFLAGASGTPWDAVIPGYFATNFDPSTNLNYGTAPETTGEILKDRRGNRVDIGKYISVVAEEPTFSNGSISTSYNGLGAGVYAGLVSQLVPQSAPTNKLVGGIIGLRYAKSLSQLDRLTGSRYVTFRTTNRGIVVTDAPVGSRPTSDYNRLQVVRIVNAVMKLTRTTAEPFIGEPSSDAMKNALKAALDKVYKNFVAQGALRQYSFTIQASDAEMVLGELNIFLTLVPQFEVRKIRAVVTMKPSL